MNFLNCYDYPICTIILEKLLFSFNSLQELRIFNVYPNCLIIFIPFSRPFASTSYMVFFLNKSSDGMK